MTGLGVALAHQNEATMASLKAAGHKMDFGSKIGKAITVTSYPFEKDPKVAARMAKLGASLVGADVSSPIVWPDMAEVEAKARAAKPPMSDEAKEKLRQYADAHPKDVGDQVAVWLRECKDLDAVYVKGAEYLGEPVDVLKGKYAKLNAGQQRMTIGNRMRAKWKKENLSAAGRAVKIEPAKDG